MLSVTKAVRIAMALRNSEPYYAYKRNAYKNMWNHPNFPFERSRYHSCISDDFQVIIIEICSRISLGFRENSIVCMC